MRKRKKRGAHFSKRGNGAKKANETKRRKAAEAALQYPQVCFLPKIVAGVILQVEVREEQEEHAGPLAVAAPKVRSLSPQEPRRSRMEETEEKRGTSRR